MFILFILSIKSNDNYLRNRSGISAIIKPIYYSFLSSFDFQIMMSTFIHDLNLYLYSKIKDIIYQKFVVNLYVLMLKIFISFKMHRSKNKSSILFLKILFVLIKLGDSFTFVMSSLKIQRIHFLGIIWTTDLLRTCQNSFLDYTCIFLEAFFK